MKMKKITFILCLIVTMTLLSGCGNSARHSLSDDRIDTQLELQIRRDFRTGTMNIADIYIPAYFGTFGENVAIIITAVDLEYPTGFFRIIIGDFDFGDVLLPFILIYREGIFIRLEEAYEYQFITTDDLQSIFDQWNPIFICC